MKTLQVLLLIFCFATISYAGDKWFLDTPKDSIVILKIPVDNFGFQKWSVWSGRTSYAAAIGQSSDGVITVKGDREWRSSGWAWMQEFVLKKAGYENKMPVAELRAGTVNIKLNFDSSITDLNKAFKEVAFVGNLYQFQQSDYYQKEVVDRQLPRIFNGKLSKIPGETQLKLVEAVKYDSKYIKGEEFKGKFYLVLGGSDDIIYNTIQVNQAERTAKTIEKLINIGIRNMPDVINTPDIDGLKVEFKVFFKDFLREANPNSEDLHAYFLFENLKQFKEADITNQQLVDKSIILVNGNRVQVSLTQFN
ncbi:MAG TPA: hypothetical protein VF721_19570 [Pyrinomonadaceae bacterium]|jgi:hypothetical protein